MHELKSFYWQPVKAALEHAVNSGAPIHEHCGLPIVPGTAHIDSEYNACMIVEVSNEQSA